MTDDFGVSLRRATALLPVAVLGGAAALGGAALFGGLGGSYLLLVLLNLIAGVWFLVLLGIGLYHIQRLTTGGSQQLRDHAAVPASKGSARSRWNASSAAPRSAASSPSSGVRSRTCSRHAGNELRLIRLRT